MMTQPEKSKNNLLNCDWWERRLDGVMRAAVMLFMFILLTMIVVVLIKMGDAEFSTLQQRTGTVENIYDLSTERCTVVVNVEGKYLKGEFRDIRGRFQIGEAVIVFVTEMGITGRYELDTIKKIENNLQQNP